MDSNVAAEVLLKVFLRMRKCDKSKCVHTISTGESSSQASAFAPRVCERLKSFHRGNGSMTCYTWSPKEALCSPDRLRSGAARQGQR
ncbi:hypothetical protein JOB18_030253 [Solea senegalensis]|uniref:Uncharacterized protein n=1 Tax=Solea senegalensis TaxID=28829 RepID=A0AAV6P9Q8_SOLSE|nr:hypothetical protein JOB18_030253 [Solea senegalensis]